MGTLDILFASRQFSPLWLPPGFNSPSLHGDGLPQWYWRCDLEYLSWMSGVLQKKPELTPAQRKAIDLIRSYVCATHNVTDDDRSALLPGGGPLATDLITDSLGLFDCYCGPAWDGMTRLARYLGLEREKRLRELVD